MPSFEYFIFALSGSGAATESKTVCFGDSIQLKCNQNQELQIETAFLEVLDVQSKRCNHLNRTSLPCMPTRLVSLVRNSCAGKGSCTLGHVLNDDQKNYDCRAALALTVQYNCGRPLLLKLVFMNFPIPLRWANVLKSILLKYFSISLTIWLMSILRLSMSTFLFHQGITISVYRNKFLLIIDTLFPALICHAYLCTSLSIAPLFANYHF